MIPYSSVMRRSVFRHAQCATGSIAPFSSSATHKLTSVAGLLQWNSPNAVADVQVHGFIRSVRAQKLRTFIAFGDGSSLDPLQAVVPVDRAEGLTIGAAVRLTGSWVPSPGRGQSHELHVQNAEILGPSDPQTYPLQKKYQTPEYLRTLPHLRPRIPFNSALIRFRSAMMASLSRFFEHRDFAQTHTPILTSSDCEGAGDVFAISTPEPQSQALDRTAEPFFKRPVYTTVSAQLHLEALAQAVGNVWTLSPTFRAEKSDTSRHLSEFYMLEAELGFTEHLESVMCLVEDMLRHVSVDLSETAVVRELCSRTGERVEDMASPDLVRRRWDGLKLLDWPRITYTEAMDVLRTSHEPFEHQPNWGEDLRTEHEKFIAIKVGGGIKPVFVTHYPRAIKPFYMKTEAAEFDTAAPMNTAECFDLLVPDFCEIAGGSMREHRLAVLLESMKIHGLDSSPSSNLNWYADLRRWGCPPHGGFGLGFDRLVSYLSGVQTIRDTTAFPRWYGRCDC